MYRYSDKEGIPMDVAMLTAKINMEKGEWLPLWIHSLDTCGVIEYLVSEWLSENTKRALKNELSEEEIKAII